MLCFPKCSFISSYWVWKFWKNLSNTSHICLADSSNVAYCSYDSYCRKYTYYLGSEINQRKKYSLQLLEIDHIKHPKSKDAPSWVISVFHIFYYSECQHTFQRFIFLHFAQTTKSPNWKKYIAENAYVMQKMSNFYYVSGSALFNNIINQRLTSKLK